MINNMLQIPLFAKSGIKIKEKNKGLFTKYCNGKVTQKCIDKAKKSGNKKLIKRAVFAENSRKWKHLKGGSLYSAENIIESLYRGASKESLGTPWNNYDFNTSDNLKIYKNGGLILKFQNPATPIKRLDINGLKNDPDFKKDYNLYMHIPNLEILEDSMISRNMGLPQRVAVFSLVIPESGGDTKPHGNGAFGLLGWRGSRAIDLPEDASGQTHKIMSEIYDNPIAKDWSHGGKGTGVQTGKEMMNLFINTNNTNQAVKAFMKGYVRPEESEWKRRLTLANLIKKHMK